MVCQQHVPSRHPETFIAYHKQRRADVPDTAKTDRLRCRLCRVRRTGKNEMICAPFPPSAPMCWACVLGGDPGRLALAPQGVGYVGTMRMGLDRRPVALWPAGAAPDLPLWQKAAQGPEAGAGAPLLDQPRVEFLGPDGARLPLNPHQWLADNGPCLPSAAGVLCLWHDRPPHAAAAAVPLAMSLRL